MFLSFLAAQPSAECRDNDSYDCPKNSAVQGIPHRFLRGCHSCCAEKDKRACRTHMHELRQKNAFRVRINPREQHSHGRHGHAERKKKWQPIGTMWGGGPKVVNYRKVPESPEQPKKDRCSQAIILGTHFRECIALPANFFQQTS